MPNFEDPYDLQRPLPSRPPYSGPMIGHDDLNPPPLFGSGLVSPEGLPRPARGPGATGQGGGMYMDIRPRREEPPPGVPPGARWDPIGPGRGGRGGGPNPFDGYMDQDFI